MMTTEATNTLADRPMRTLDRISHVANDLAGLNMRIADTLDRIAQQPPVVSNDASGGDRATVVYSYTDHLDRLESEVKRLYCLVEMLQGHV